MSITRVITIGNQIVTATLQPVQSGQLVNKFPLRFFHGVELVKRHFVCDLRVEDQLRENWLYFEDEFCVTFGIFKHPSFVEEGRLLIMFKKGGRGWNWVRDEGWERCFFIERKFWLVSGGRFGFLVVAEIIVVFLSPRVMKKTVGWFFRKGWKYGRKSVESTVEKKVNN